MTEIMDKNMKFDAKYIIKSHLNLKSQYDSVAWYKLYKDCLKKCDNEMKLDNPNCDYKSVTIYRFVARYALRQIRNLKDDEYQEVVKSHLASLHINKILDGMCKNPNIISLGVQVFIDESEYKTRWEKLKVILDENFPAELIDLKNDFYSTYSNALFYAKWKFEKIVQSEYFKLDFWQSRPATDAIEREITIDECFVNFYFDDKEKKPKINKKTGLRKPEFTSFVLPRLG